MSKRKALNERRLTKQEVARYVAARAIPRPDLERTFADAQIGLRPPRIYELEGGQILRVFNDAESGIGGKGDIFTPDRFHRFLAWAIRVRENARAGRNSSVSHWFYHSKLRAALPSQAQELVQDLARIISGPSSRLDISYAGLDAASRHIDDRGRESAGGHL